jgi:hypothetical protein
MTHLSFEGERNARPAPVHVLAVINNEIEFVPSTVELEVEVSRAKPAAVWNLRNSRIIQSHEQPIVMAENRIYVGEPATVKAIAANKSVISCITANRIEGSASMNVGPARKQVLNRP